MTFPDVINLKVNHVNIVDGVRASCGWCPIALALRDIFPSAGRVYVFGDVARIIFPFPSAEGLYRLSEDARAFIRAFDSYRPVTPTTLRLEKLS